MIHHRSDGAARATGISVVVATRNRRDRLLTSLDQTVAARPDEVIVVDNGSTDGTADAVRHCFPDVHVVALNGNRGAAARTIGVQAATHELIAFSDDDSWWAATALDRAARYFSRHPHVGLLAARVLVGAEGRLDPVSAVMADSPLPRQRSLPGPSVLGFLACGALVRREAYLAAGGFSRVLFFIGEEHLLALDLVTAGWDLVYVPDVVAHHVPESAGGDTARQALALRNDLLTLWLRRPLDRALRGTGELTQRALVDPVARRALLGAMRRLPRALAARRPVPARVECAVRLLEQAS